MPDLFKRRALAVQLGLLIALAPASVDMSWDSGLAVAVPFAFADGDSGGHGSGGDDDNSGRGGGDDDDDNDDDDYGGPDGGANGGKNSPNSNEPVTLHISYSNGWQESIRNGRYRLVDPKGRVVADRKAKRGDVARMREYLGQ